MSFDFCRAEIVYDARCVCTGHDDVTSLIKSAITGCVEAKEGIEWTRIFHAFCSFAKFFA